MVLQGCVQCERLCRSQTTPSCLQVGLRPLDHFPDIAVIKCIDNFFKKKPYLGYISFLPPHNPNLKKVRKLLIFHLFPLSFRCFLLIFCVVGTEPRDSHIEGKCFTTQLLPQPSFPLFQLCHIAIC